MTAVVFGDVHGDSQKLEKLIALARERFGQVAFYSLGDLIDRGPDSKGVLDICVRENVLGILGNHELWFWDACSGLHVPEGILQPVMGSLATLRSYGLNKGDYRGIGPALFKTVPQAHKDFILSLPPFRRLEVGGRTFWLVHTGLSADTAAGVLHEVGRPLDDETLLQLALKVTPGVFFWVSPNIREGKLHRFASGATQILGHTPIQSPVVRPNHFVALDTGCGTCPPFTLSALVLRDDGTSEIVRVS